MGGSGLDRSDDFHKFCESGLDWIQFYRIRTGLGLKNLSVRSSLENMKNYYKTNIKTSQSKIANLGIIHRAIKSAGRLYTISLLVNYTVKAELRSFCYSMLHPNNACRKHLILFLSEKEKIFNTKALVTCKRSAAVAKKLTNYEHLAVSETKKHTQFLEGFISPVHFVVAMENTLNPSCHLIHKWWQKIKLSRWTTA